MTELDGPEGLAIPDGSPAPSDSRGPVTIDQLLAGSRTGLERVHPRDLEREMAEGALVVDTRPVDQRDRDGRLPGAVVIDRNVLEWRLAPSSPHRIPGAGAADRRIVIVCNEGYSSSLAASTLQQLGLSRATDLIGGFQAWAALRRRSDFSEGGPPRLPGT